MMTSESAVLETEDELDDCCCDTLDCAMSGKRMKQVWGTIKSCVAPKCAEKWERTANTAEESVFIHHFPAKLAIEMPSTPPEIFRHFLTDLVFEDLASYTAAYARLHASKKRQPNSVLTIRASDVKSYLSVLILGGALQLSSVSEFWKCDNYSVPLSRDKFHDITRFFQVSHPGQFVRRYDDKYNRLHSFVQRMNEMFRSCVQPCSKLLLTPQLEGNWDISLAQCAETGFVRSVSFCQTVDHKIHSSDDLVSFARCCIAGLESSRYLVYVHPHFADLSLYTYLKEEGFRCFGVPHVSEGNISKFPITEAVEHPDQVFHKDEIVCSASGDNHAVVLSTFMDTKLPRFHQDYRLSFDDCHSLMHAFRHYRVPHVDTKKLWLKGGFIDILNVILNNCYVMYQMIAKLRHFNVVEYGEFLKQIALCLMPSNVKSKFSVFLTDPDDL